MSLLLAFRLLPLMEVLLRLMVQQLLKGRQHLMMVSRPMESALSRSAFRKAQDSVHKDHLDYLDYRD
jgi:hypothetical protein